MSLRREGKSRCRRRAIAAETRLFGIRARRRLWPTAVWQLVEEQDIRLRDRDDRGPRALDHIDAIAAVDASMGFSSAVAISRFR